MSYVTKFVLLMVAALCVQDTTCRLDRKQLIQLLQNMYSSEQQPAVSRRNIADLSNIPATGILQEASSRDLDVGFSVGVKDEGSDSDSVINNHSSKSAYLPTSVIDQAIPGVYALDPPSKELNIGLFVDPKNGITYYSPGYVPQSSLTRPSAFPETYDGVSSVQNIVQPNPVITSTAYPVLLNPYQHFPLTNLFNLGGYATPRPVPNYVQNPINSVSEFNGLPSSLQNNPKKTPSRDGYFAVAPLGTYSPNNAERSLDFNNLQQTIYPYRRLFQQPFEVPYNSKSFSGVPDQFLDSLHQQPITSNSLYSSMYPQNDRLFSSAKHYQQVSKGSYRQFFQPAVAMLEPQEPQLILDRQGTPVMSAQPYGERQVGTFRLRNDNGYQVLMDVPPIPTDEPTDGVLVMEMKATLYRPL